MNIGVSISSGITRPIWEQPPSLRILLAIGLCASVTSYLLFGCGSGGGGRDASKQQQVSSSTPSLVIASVRDMGVIRQNPAILKRDGGYSAMHGDRSIWLFGDTLLDTPNGENVICPSSSCSATYDTDAGDGIAGLSEEVDTIGMPPQFFPLTEEEKAFNLRNVGKICEEENCTAHWRMWPGAIVVDDEKGWAYTFYRKVLVEKGVYNFHHVGHSIAVLKGYAEASERPVFNYYPQYPTMFFAEQGDRGFGSAAVVVDNDVFIYGCELGEEQLTKPCHVARVPLANILDRHAWTFYSGDGKWSRELHDSVNIFNGNDMMTVFFNAYINRYIAVYSEPLGATAMLRTADRPEGPWSEPVALFTVDAPANTYGWVYDFLAHPEFSRDDDNIIYVTYTKKTDSMHSQLHLVAVEFELELSGR